MGQAENERLEPMGAGTRGGMEKVGGTMLQVTPLHSLSHASVMQLLFLPAAPSSAPASPAPASPSSHATIPHGSQAWS